MIKDRQRFKHYTRITLTTYGFGQHMIVDVDILGPSKSLGFRPPKVLGGVVIE